MLCIGSKFAYQSKWSALFFLEELNAIKLSVESHAISTLRCANSFLSSIKKTVASIYYILVGIKSDYMLDLFEKFEHSFPKSSRETIFEYFESDCISLNHAYIQDIDY
jgi:hypothetical protein